MEAYSTCRTKCMILTTLAVALKYIHDIMQIPNGEPSQNSMLCRAAGCRCQVAKFLLSIPFQSQANQFILHLINWPLL
jgi:hypothetical protein